MSGLGDVGDSGKIKSHLRSVYRYNLRESLLEHANPQRPGYALGDEAGLLLCTWPHGGKPALPFVYRDEVWTGIEYQVASHLIAMGEVKWAWISSGNAGAGTRAGCAIPLTSTSAVTGMPGPWPPMPCWKP